MKVAATYAVARADDKVRIWFCDESGAVVRLELNPALAADLGADITAAAKGDDT